MKRTRMPAQSKKRAAKYKGPEGRAALDYMGAVKRLHCVVCGASPCEAHHWYHDRYSSRKTSDFEVIPLCVWCHQDGPQSVHKDKAGWKERHGPDHSYTEPTRRNVAVLLGAAAWKKITQHMR
jgi:hypothetical protein